jgi:N-methylhydantoinase A
MPAQNIRLARTPANGDAFRGRRTVYFPGHGDLEAAVYDRYSLRPGLVVPGPAVVQERETSCAFGPDCHCQLDDLGNLILELEPAATAESAEQPIAFVQEI